MTKEEENKFLEKNFKAGEYAVLTLMVRNEDLQHVVDILKTSDRNLVIIPKVTATIDYLNDKVNKLGN